jgi:hypothetical protein
MVFSAIVEIVNKTSPYKIFLKEEGHYGGSFETDKGLTYNISLIKIIDIPIDEMYYIAFESVEARKNRHDPKIGETITAVISSCIDIAKNIIIFTCDNSDRKQEARNILFKRWFKKHIKKEYFRYDKSPNDTFDGIYASFICDINNPNIDKCMTLFDENFF